MAAGIAIVTTDIPANRELVEDGVSALLVQPDEIEGLSAAISRLLDHPQQANRLGEAARERAMRDLSVESMLSRYVDLYTSLIGRRVSINRRPEIRGAA